MNDSTMKCWYEKTCNKYGTKECSNNCIRYLEMNFLIENSNIPKSNKYAQGLTPDIKDLDAFLQLKAIKDNITDFVRNGDNLYIYSNNFGNGKTSWSIKLMQKYFNDIWAGNGFVIRGLFIYVPLFITKCKENISQKDLYFQQLKTLLPEVDLVVWDDIASSKLSDFDYTNLLTYIDQRKLNGKANIYTGNLDEDELTVALGNRLKSRVWDDSIKIEIKGNDRRGGTINGYTTNSK